MFSRLVLNAICDTLEDLDVSAFSKFMDNYLLYYPVFDLPRIKSVLRGLCLSKLNLVN